MQKLLAVALLALSTTAAQAVPLTYILQNANFDDGGTVTGSVSIDTTGVTYVRGFSGPPPVTAWNFTTSPWQSYPATHTYDSTLAANDLQYYSSLYFFYDRTANFYLSLDFSESGIKGLIDGRGIVPLLTIMPGQGYVPYSSLECTNCSSARDITTR